MNAPAPSKDTRRPPASLEPILEEPKLRMPKVRHALILWVPRGSKTDAKVTVTEQQGTVRLAVLDHAGLEREVDLQLVEARQVADHLNRIARRVATRKEYMP